MYTFYVLPSTHLLPVLFSYFRELNGQMEQTRLHASWTYFHISVLDKDVHTGTMTYRVCV